MNRIASNIASTSVFANMILSLTLGGVYCTALQAQERFDRVGGEGSIEVAFPNVVKIPMCLIAQQVERSVERVAPVERLVLGTRWKGNAHCQAEVTCSLNSNSEAAEVLICMVGSVVSKTSGKHGPACIESISTTSFIMHKPVFFDGEQFSTEPASAIAKTDLEVAKISSKLGGTKGSIVCSVATKKVNESLSAAEEITNTLTTKELCQQLDMELDGQLQELNESLESHFGSLSRFVRQNLDFRAKSHTSFVEIAVTPKTVISVIPSRQVHLTKTGTDELSLVTHPQ